MKGFSCVLHRASFGFPTFHVRERQNQHDMVYVLAKLVYLPFTSYYIGFTEDTVVGTKKVRLQWFPGSSRPAALHRVA